MRIVDQVQLKRQTGEAGYTLTEMLVVIGIISVIAAVLTPTLMGHLSRAKAKAAQLQLKNVAAAAELFKEDVGRYPSQIEGLKVLVTAPPATEGWTGPYVEDIKSLNDPWGQPIIYAFNPGTNRFQVTSLGADSRPGGEGANRDLQAPAQAP